MDNIKLPASERSPGIDFNFDDNLFHLKGESYPEDIASFYGDLLQNLGTHFDSLDGAKINFIFDLIYFNSSTAKVLMNLFELLDEAGNKNDVTVTWNYETDDDNMEEMGEEFGEDLEHATFILKEIEIK